MAVRANRRATGRVNQLRMERLAAKALEQPAPPSPPTKPLEQPAPPSLPTKPLETGPPTFTGRQQISVGKLVWGVIPGSYVEHLGDGRIVRVVGPDRKLHHLTTINGAVAEILFSAELNEAVLRKLEARGMHN